MGETSRTGSSEAITFDAEWLLTMNGPAIRKGRVCIEQGRITAAGPVGYVPVIGRHVPLGQSVLMPGLVNAHCHLELSAYHGTLPPGDLWTWFAELVRLRLEPQAPAREQAAVPAAVRSMLESGTTCVGDISRAEWLPRILADLPIRKVCYIELITGAISPPADMDQLRQRLAGLPASDPLLVPAISPHTPYTVTREDLQSCAALALHEHLPLAIHLAETQEEVEWLRRGTGRIAEWHRRFFTNPPRSPAMGAVEHVIAAGVTTGTALVHMNYADDWRRLCELPQQHRPVIVYCPRSHHFFGYQPHPFQEMLQAGLVVAIGTDSAASHSAGEPRPVSVLDELRWLRRNRPEISPRTLLEMATAHGAVAIGMADKIGRIVPGLAADLIAFEISSDQIADPAAEILDAEHSPSLVQMGNRVAGELE